MPKIRILVFFLFLVLFIAIPYLGNREAPLDNLPLFQTFADDTDYIFTK